MRRAVGQEHNRLELRQYPSAVGAGSIERMMIDNCAVERRRGVIHLLQRGCGRHVIAFRLESEPERVPKDWAWRNDKQVSHYCSFRIERADASEH